jgi:O-antigen/teichoic acid export membrane protein
LKSKLLQNLSANTVQLLVNQLCGLVIFYILSTQLTKDSFGKLNFVLAIMLTAFGLLTLGIDQVLIKKIAIKQSLHAMLSVYFFHVILSGLVFYALLFGCSLLITPNHEIYPLLLLIGLGKLMLYFSTPFKTVASGLERFKLLALMLIISNVTRSFGLLILALFKIVTLKEVTILFILGDVTEFVCCAYLFKRKIKIPINIFLIRKSYLTLLREALPQTGVVIITSAMARLDWIFIGFMASAIKLAEYSFAYKIFEIATLPLLAIAPLLLPWLTKLFNNHDPTPQNFRLIVKIELVVAMATFLILNILWIPTIDFMTKGKYGSINADTIFLLSLSIPFLYVNNFLWTIYFSQGRLRMILFGFIITFLINVILNMILIPFLGNEGAAVSFLIATIAQALFYLQKNQIPSLHLLWKDICICLGSGLACYFSLRLIIINEFIMVIISLLAYLLCLALLGQIKWEDRKMLSKFFNG